MAGKAVRNRAGERSVIAPRRFRVADIAQHLRLISGIILFLFAATHFLNHASGLISLELMHEVQQWRWSVTRSWPGTIILVSALLTHVVLGLYKTATRATLRLSAWELVQLGLGVTIPFLLLPHIVNTRIAHVFFGVEDTYLYELARLWPASAVLQSLLLIIVWAHGCLGLHKWLTFKSWYRHAEPLLIVLAVAIPVLALCGFMISGRSISELTKSPEQFKTLKELTHWPSPAAQDALARYRLGVRVFFGAALALAVAAFVWRRLALTGARRIIITYTGGLSVKTPVGPTLLEMSRLHRVPHASACGGRARCSTCRVRIETSEKKLPRPAFAEAFTLASIGAEPGIRLACQIRPRSSLTVTKLVREANFSPGDIAPSDLDAAGTEKPLAIMMVDLRDYTRMAQGRLPYDVVYVLNEFFAATGNAIVTHHGTIDKYLGDGFLAFFGRERGVQAGCRDALCAVRAIDLALDHVNAKLEAELGSPLRIAIGLHAGECIIGRIGFGRSREVTVIGNAVNVASRLEAVAKAHGFQIVASKDVIDNVAWPGNEAQTIEVEVRGVVSKMQVIGIARGRDLPISILTQSPEEYGNA
ncbi:MAG TPA: adenylate/guanylate cyclase domain-containing protein [Geobacterales bacterium]|nr:adenylate/guanylate cyclase domain-containing protein [Geobacterales bacterium]